MLNITLTRLELVNQSIEKNRIVDEIFLRAHFY